MDLVCLFYMNVIFIPYHRMNLAKETEIYSFKRISFILCYHSPFYFKKLRIRVTAGRRLSSFKFLVASLP
jgi:hypothetical protein